MEHNETSRTELQSQPENEPIGLKISDIFDVIENGRYTPGSIERVVIDSPGVEGGTHTRLYDAMSPSGTVIVLKNYAKHYKPIMELYYGEGKKERFGDVYTKH